MEQIDILEVLYRMWMFLMGAYTYRVWVRATAREGVIFHHCICSHGFENDADCREYLTGVRDANIRTNNRD
jgi:hypothetical protein